MSEDSLLLLDQSLPLVPLKHSCWTINAPRTLLPSQFVLLSPHLSPTRDALRPAGGGVHLQDIHKDLHLQVWKALVHTEPRRARPRHGSRPGIAAGGRPENLRVGRMPA